MLQTILKNAGIEVPSTAPVFLTALGFHVLAGLVCVIAGIIAMLSRKRPGLHPKWGTTYYWSLATLFASASVLAAMRFKEDFLLFILGMISFSMASLGRIARRRVWQNWATVHISCMGLSYIVMLTAFYVDNGKNLPVWRDLPHVTYWLLPSVVGIPLVVRALFHHRRGKYAEVNA